MLKVCWRAFTRAWAHHTATQIATLSVLIASYTVITFFFTVSTNVSRILTQWGDSVQMTVYLKENLDDKKRLDLESQLNKIPDFEDVEYVPREDALRQFRGQLASYAPELLDDRSFEDSFPASFQLTLKGGVHNKGQFDSMTNLAQKVATFIGVEDVSYGQNWVENYSSFVTGIKTITWFLVVVLLAGSVLVVGNSIKNSVLQRQEEIEIMELVGATRSMIRKPYVFEGLLMGAIAAVLAIVLSYMTHYWGMKLASIEFGFLGISSIFRNLHPLHAAAMVLAGALFGALGALLSVRMINDGFAAAKNRQTDD